MKMNAEDAKLIQEYLKKGGTITKCPVVNPEPKKPSFQHFIKWRDMKPGSGRNS